MKVGKLKDYSIARQPKGIEDPRNLVQKTTQDSFEELALLILKIGEYIARDGYGS